MMPASAIAFYVLSAFLLITALLSVTGRQIFRSAIWLLFSLLGVAAIYFWLDLNLLAAVQIVVYVGGIEVSGGIEGQTVGRVEIARGIRDSPVNGTSTSVARLMNDSCAGCSRLPSLPGPRKRFPDCPPSTLKRLFLPSAWSLSESGHLAALS